MPKQQTLTIVVADSMEDPAELIESALQMLLLAGPIHPRYEDDVEHRFQTDRAYNGYLIVEEP